MKTELRDKIIVITGGSSGIGAAAARKLAKEGAKVVITGRSEETKRIAQALNCDYFLVDFASFAAVRQFAGQLLEKYPRIDVLVNNVGGIISDRRLTEDSHEMTLQVNHLSGFLLTQLLQERLEASGALVINTSSMANTLGRINFKDLESEQGYNDMMAYGAAKQMNILHAMEISRRFRGVKAASFHPGVVATGFARAGKAYVRWIYNSFIGRLFFLTPEKGADTLIWLILAEEGKDWKSGGYYYKRKPGRKNAQVSAATAHQLWEASEKLVNRQP